ncbi:MAG: adenosylcobinamide-phosphate synthase CbiB [Tannerellaceae bacterium]|nr:adenosylcobinamide-phosphate synthase CbiB [Tannerellaceae bacterium]
MGLFSISQLCFTIPFLTGWLADKLLGDPEQLPHPIVWFGKGIASGEKRLNKGSNRFLKGVFLSGILILSVFLVTWYILQISNSISFYLTGILTAIGVFYCLAGTTLIREVRMVFDAVEKGLPEARKQLSRIVGRDTSALSEQEIRTAALETLAENLSDGVIAPMFWFALLGLPGMMAYKMVNTLDSMVGYKNERYMDFGKAAARIDDIANYIPARLTAFLLLLAAGKLNKFTFVLRYGWAHASPNSGYPEAALAGILNCRFGGPNYYFGKKVEKPYIGNNNRLLTYQDMKRSTRICSIAELGMGILVCITLLFI